MYVQRHIQGSQSWGEGHCTPTEIRCEGIARENFLNLTLKFVNYCILDNTFSSCSIVICTLVVQDSRRRSLTVHCPCGGVCVYVLCAVCSPGQCSRCIHLYTRHRFSNLIHYYLQVIISRLRHCPSLTNSRLFQCHSVTSSRLCQCPSVIRSRPAIGQHRLLTVTRHSRISANLSSLSTKLCSRRLQVCMYRELYPLHYHTYQ